MTPRSSSRRWLHLPRPLLLALLIAYCLFLAWIVLWPSPAPASDTVAHAAAVLRQAGAPTAVTASGRVEFALNTLMVVPVPLLASLLWRRWSWQHWTTFGFVASCCVELFQGLFIPHRSAQMADVVSNTFGSLIGALVGGAVGGRVTSGRIER